MFPLSLHDALPIFGLVDPELEFWWELALLVVIMLLGHWIEMRSLEQTSSALDSLAALLPDEAERVEGDEIVTVSPDELQVDRKSTRLNSSHVAISYVSSFPTRRSSDLRTRRPRTGILVGTGLARGHHAAGPLD